MILVAGLSPAWQQIMRFDALHVGAVNRASEVHWCASGKVINVALALKRLGADVEMLATIGGASGESIRQEMNAAGVKGHYITTGTATRVCTTLLDSSNGEVTELVENTAAATNAELDAFSVAYGALAQRAEMVLLTGSLPAGAPSDYYRSLLDRTPCPAILDFRGQELLSTLANRPLLVKPNREELARTLGRDLANEQELFAAMSEVQTNGAQWIAISDGPRALLVCGPEGRYRLEPPVVQPINPIASGDCLAAGVAWGLSQGMGMLESLQLGVAAAAENVADMLPARLDPNTVRQRAVSVPCESV